MPTYEYSCKLCGHFMEVFQSMKDAPLTECPECSRPGLKRLMGRGAGIIFKGSGFYETDYKKSPAKASDKSSESASTGAAASEKAPAASSSSTSPPAKPAATT